MALSPMEEKLIAREAPGAAPAKLSVIVPSIVEPGEPFTVKLSVLDKEGYPSLNCEAVARFSDSLEGLPTEIAFEAGRPALAQIDGVSLPEPGLRRIAVELNGQSFLSNPILCRPNVQQRLWWGDPHVHTLLSNCIPEASRSLQFGYLCARCITGLDWVCVTDHVSNGRSDPGKWKTQRIFSLFYDEPGTFTNLLAYEASLKGGCGGDNNVYFPGDAEEYVDEYEEGNVRTLVEELSQLYDEFIVVPHHTTRGSSGPGGSGGKHGELNADLYMGPEYMPVVEIYSKWGASEYRGNPDPLKEVHPGPSYVQDFLAQGFRFGFIGGTDSHATMSGGYGKEPEHIARRPGLTAVRSPILTRRNLFESIQQRNCYATSAERIIVEAELAGQRMGTEQAWPNATRPRRIQATVATETDIDRVDIVRNGEDIASFSAEGWQLNIDYTDSDNLSEVAFPPTPSLDRPFVYYYLRVSCASGARAWSSPVWLLLENP